MKDAGAAPQIVQDNQDERLQAAFGKGMEPVSFIGVAFHLKSVLHRRVAAARLANDRNSKHAHRDRSKSMRAARKSVAEHGAAEHGSTCLLRACSTGECQNSKGMPPPAPRKPVPRAFSGPAKPIAARAIRQRRSACVI